jgi:hypothetical protein
MVETMISLATILASSNIFVQWTQEGFKDPTVPGSIRFTSHDGQISMYFQLHCRDGLYYCNSDIYTVNTDPVHVHCYHTLASPLRHGLKSPPRKPSSFTPTTRSWQVESEVWALRFGSPGEHQLDVLPQHVISTPSSFEYHPFYHIDFKEQAYSCKQAAGQSAKQIQLRGSAFFMDFGFMQASADTDDYKCPNKTKDKAVLL